jgi:hypothetical protein
LPASAEDRSQSTCSGLRSFVADQDAEFQLRHLHPVFVVSSNELLKKLSRYGYPTEAKSYHTVKKAIRGLTAQLAQEADLTSKV